MVEQIKELGTETYDLSLTELKGLADREIHIRLIRANDAIPRRVPITGGAIRGIRDRRCRLIGIRVDPVCNLCGEGPGLQSVAAIETGSEVGCRNRRTGQRVGRCAVGIKNRDRRTRLRDNYAVDLPSTKRISHSITAIGEERQGVIEAGNKALAMIEVGKAARRV